MSIRKTGTGEVLPENPHVSTESPQASEENPKVVVHGSAGRDYIWTVQDEQELAAESRED